MQGQLRSPHTGPFGVRAAQRAAGARGMCFAAGGVLIEDSSPERSDISFRSFVCDHRTRPTGAAVAWRGVAWGACVGGSSRAGTRGRHTCTHAFATHLPRDADPVEVGVVEPEDRVDRRRRARHHVAAEELVHLLVRVLVSHLRHGRRSGRVASGVCVGAEVTAAGLPKGRGWVLRLPGLGLFRVGLGSGLCWRSCPRRTCCATLPGSAPTRGRENAHDVSSRCEVTRCMRV